MNKWIFAIIIAALFGGVFFGTTNWAWWTCICAGLLAMWLCTLIFMAITNATLNGKKELLAEIDRHEKLENRLVDDVVSLIELYNYLMPNSSVMPPNGTTEKLHQAMVDIDEFMKNRKGDKDFTQISKKYKIGDIILLPMEDGNDAAGTVISYENNLYRIRFPYAVSLMEKEEPEGGWSDNAWPEKELLLSEATVDAIKQGFYTGTTCHYHF